MLLLVVPGQDLCEMSSTAVSQTTQPVSTSSSGVTEATTSQASASSAEIPASNPVAQIPLAAGSLINARPGSMVRVPEIANGRKYSKSIFHFRYFYM